MDSRPEMVRVACCVLRALSAWVTSGNRHSRINVLFPEPLTPVTQTSRPSGNFTVRFLRLFFEALYSVNICPAFMGRRLPRVGYFLCARKHFPVSDSG